MVSFEFLFLFSSCKIFGGGGKLKKKKMKFSKKLLFSFYFRDIESRDVKVNIIIMFLFEISLIVISLFLTLSGVFGIYNGDMEIYKTGWHSLLFAFMIFLNLFTLKYYLEAHLFIFTCAIFMECLIVYIVNDGSILHFNLVTYLVASPFFTIVLSNNIYLKLFWLVMSILFVIGQLVHNFIFKMEVWIFLEGVTITMLSRKFNYCLFIFPPTVAVSLSYFIYYQRLLKEEKYIEKIGNCIARLEIDSPLLQKLKKKKKYLCTDIEEAFKYIIVNFEAYIPYLPQSLKYKSHESSCSMGTPNIESIGSTIEKNEHNHSLGSSSSNASRYSNASRNTDISPNRSAFSSIIFDNKNNLTKTKLKSKSITYMILFIPELNNVLNEQGQYELVIKTINETVSNNNGITENIFNDTVISAWNSVRNSVEHSIEACKCACEIVEKLKRIQFDHRVRIVLTSSDYCFCGTIGGALSKYEVRICPSFDFLYILGNINNVKDMKHSILITEKVYKSVHYYSNLKLINCIEFNEHCENVYRLESMKNEKANEWMYQIGESLTIENALNNKNSFEGIFGLMKLKNWIDAERVLTTKFRDDIDYKFILKKIKKKTLKN